MFEFKLPDLGEGVHEGEILNWHVEPGASIQEDDPLVDVETDKAAITIPSPRSGKIVSLKGKVGDTVFVGEVIVAIDDGTESGVSVSTAGEEPAALKIEASSDPLNANREAKLAAASRAPAVGVPAASWGRAIAAPATRRLARELNVDIQRIPPTGPAGRVTPEDVTRFAGQPEAPPQADESVPQSEQIDNEEEIVIPSASGIPFLEIERLPDFGQWGPVEIEPVRSIRRKVARKMVTSMILVPHVAHMDEADVTLLEELRHKERERRSGQPGGKMSLLSFVIKAVTAGLKTFPAFNASLDPFGERIIYKKYYNLGIAVDSERGLMVPNIRDADRKSILQISTEIEELASKARESELTVADLRGGTFTITNVGALGGTGMVPTINYPEAAILGMARVQEKPVVVDGEIVIRKRLPLTLAFDHRVTDGADAARFVSEIVRRLSDPNTLLIEA